MIIQLNTFNFIIYSGCDACEDWYHGDCIGITKKQSKLIKHYYCDVCSYYLIKIFKKMTITNLSILI